MTRIIRWDPNREMKAMLESVDRVFDGTHVDSQSHRHFSHKWGIPLDVVEAENEFIVKASIPGINLEDIEITQEGDMLAIKGEISEEKEDNNKHYHLRERRYGSFCRSVHLPKTIKRDDINAAYKDGILSIHLPKTEEAKPKKIAVKSIDSQKVIESGE
jgi:HSP20 family protein